MTRQVMAGSVAIGGGAPVSVQSMTNTDTADVKATLAQIDALQNAGCDIVRISVYNTACAEAVQELKKHTATPLVADIHFDYQLALMSIANGIDKLRINPGNIGNERRVAEVIAAAKERNIPIRIGVNAGSLKKELADKHGGRNAAAMVESALEHIAILERLDFHDIVVSVKHSAVDETVRAYRLLHEKTEYPLHLGVTEAGTERMAIVKSAAGIGSLLLDGIGDTIRVSISGDPVKEIGAGKDILRACGLLHDGVEIIACPTCGRKSMDVSRIADELAGRVVHIKTPVKAAVMGCVVNGPGEASMADVGIAGAGDTVSLFVEGKVQRRIAIDDAVDVLVKEIEKIAQVR